MKDNWFAICMILILLLACSIIISERLDKLESQMVEHQQIIEEVVKHIRCDINLPLDNITLLRRLKNLE